MSEKPLLEISLDGGESALAAEQGGACRIELCANLLEGGVTPSAGMIAAVRRRVSIPIHVMIRPRGGDFCYSDAEFEAMRHDIDAAKNLGADGIVLGILDSRGNIDVERASELIHRARPMSATFHRAFDFVPDLNRALEDAIRAGADRILTSGGKSKAEDALEALAALVQKAGSRVTILVCGGVRAHNVNKIVRGTQAREIHVGQAGVADSVPSTASRAGPNIRLGEAAGQVHERRIVSAEKVRELIEAF